MSGLADIDLHIVVLNATDPDLGEFRELLPGAEVTVGSSKASGMGAEEFGLQILISVVGSYAFVHTNAILTGLSTLLRGAFQKQSAKPLTVIVGGIEHEIRNDRDIEALEKQLRLELENNEKE